jgi:hypothetical protein
MFNSYGSGWGGQTKILLRVALVLVLGVISAEYIQLNIYTTDNKFKGDAQNLPLRRVGSGEISP